MAIWRRRRRPDPEVEQARRRLAEAEAELRAARSDDGRVDHLARRMHEIRKANRFATMMKQALRGIE